MKLPNKLFPVRKLSRKHYFFVKNEKKRGAMQASGLGNKSNNNIDMIMYNDTTAKKKQQAYNI